jgi:antitoxin MazE
VRVTVSKWGNSLGIRIPRGVAQDAQIAEGTELDVRVEDGRVVLEALAAPNLDQMLARVTSENLHGELMSDSSVGREAW